MAEHAMTLRLDADDYEQLRRLAFDRRMSMSEIVRRAVHAVVSSTEEQAFLLDAEPTDLRHRDA